MNKRRNILILCVYVVLMLFAFSPIIISFEGSRIAEKHGFTVDAGGIRPKEFSNTPEGKRAHNLFSAGHGVLITFPLSIFGAAITFLIQTLFWVRARKNKAKFRAPKG